MVQMKDEAFEKAKKALSLIFISHMVQMKETLLKTSGLSIHELYIPHGSDESFNDTISFSVSPFFISHMVQMKVIITISFYYTFFSLYPTWFR